MVWTVKLILFVGVLYFFMEQISRLSLIQFKSLSFENPSYFILVLLLLPFNWGFELLKWQEILKVNKIEYSLKKILSSLFSGVTTGIITPNRIGNFIGRMLFFKGKVRSQLILGTLYSNFAQFSVTLIFGGISVLILHETLFEAYGFYLSNLSILITVLSLGFYFAVPFIRLPNIGVLNRKQNVLSKFQQHSKKFVFPLFFLSGARYLVFSLQFILMLMTFGIEPTIDLITGIFLLYFVSTLTPSLLFGKLVVREAAALIILSAFVENEAIIVVSSLLLWVINLGVPSLIGLFFMLSKKSFSNG